MTTTSDDTTAITIASESTAVGDVVRERCLTELRKLLGDDGVISEGRRITRYLRDFSWYSPILENALSDTGVDAVAKPTSIEELEAVIALAASLRIPLTMRGAGTGNYGQSLPLKRGIVVDIKGVAGILDVGEGRVSVLPGTVMRNVEAAAEETGQQLAVMPSTYRVATASGFICGGSGGLGAAAHGDLWSGNILAVELLTVEEVPQRIRLEGPDVALVLHMYGTTGVITKIEMRLVPARDFGSRIVLFDDFNACAEFGWDLGDSEVHCRLISLHQAPIGSMMTPLEDIIDEDVHAALLWTDRGDDRILDEMISAAGGRSFDWPENAKDVTQFPYSHTILWSRRAHPDSSWLQCEYSGHAKSEFLAQVQQLTDQYSGIFLQHIEINKSAEGGIRCMGIPPLLGLADHEASLDALLAFCTEIGVSVLNPHSFVVEEGGFVGDTAKMLELKLRSDPYGILNPGKLGKSFFGTRSSLDAETAAATDLRAPEQLADQSA